MDFVTASQNAPFLTALCVMFGLAILEGVGNLFGAGVSELIDSVFPDPDFDFDVDVDVDADIDGPTTPGIIMQGLGWLHFGKVPAMVLLVLFLASFGLSGLVLQAVVSSATGFYLPTFLAAAPALFLGVSSVRVGGRWIAEFIPKDETSAVSSDTFVGRVATIVLGTARASQPSQARLHDEHGRSHYVMVEPDLAGDELPSGTQVLLVRRDGARFRAVRAPHSMLADAASG